MQSRYYDPEIGRFLNADAFISTGQGELGNNMFAYCGNNPVKYYDPTGNFYLVAGVDDDGSFLGSLQQYIGAGSGAITTSVGSLVGTAVVLFTAYDIAEMSVFLAKKQNSKGSLTNSTTNEENTKNDNRDPNYRGGTTYSRNRRRVDYEYYGNGKGNVHIHSGGKKFWYDSTHGIFVDKAGLPAPRSIQDLLIIPEILAAIIKALEYIVG